MIKSRRGREIEPGMTMPGAGGHDFYVASIKPHGGPLAHLWGGEARIAADPRGRTLLLVPDDPYEVYAPDDPSAAPGEPLQAVQPKGLPEGYHLAYHALKPGEQRGATVSSEITVEALSDDGRGILWEFTVRELQTQPPWGKGPVITDVKISSQAYAAFAEIPALFAMLAELRPANMLAVISCLESLGAADETDWMTRNDD